MGSGGQAITWWQALSIAGVLLAGTLTAFSFIFQAHVSQPHMTAVGRPEFERTLGSIDDRLERIERRIEAMRPPG